MQELHGPWRHRRVWLKPDVEARELAVGGDERAAAAIIERARQGLPFVGRSAGVHDRPGWPTLGLALARTAGERIRLSCGVPRHVLARVEPPLTLSEALPTLPAEAGHFAAALVTQAAEIDMTLWVYGSAFWQHAGGGNYWRDTSDLDLLARPASAAQASEWLDYLEKIEATAPLRMDGEIELPSGGGVSWRELAGKSRKLLVKTVRGHALLPRAEILESWEASC
ncbi:malonate decarboxylase holo-[acyl-carrier-protein] synthase (plasmid) [Cupriavidus sp. P-10]|uniref:malonate decarboxylase holo-[acyl-carrier-protein] synthase n=1 Tax=Cupriavidus sp. P-10 TaxID=2027911 RepID=UPI000ED6BE72|nr:malonate decarboxylase holo-[acyl-carrier-protein] synthase [Cupriavidus sp. P-10]BDB30013.1 malonate decarboxylase holo-[acyl-carrier-protein] synthase [Cupriavidus sp. P-10]